MENRFIRVKPLTPIKGKTINGERPNGIIINGFPRLEIKADFVRFKGWLHTCKNAVGEKGKILIDVINPEELG